MTYLIKYTRETHDGFIEESCIHWREYDEKIVTRYFLRKAAKYLNIKRGRNKADTIINLIVAKKLTILVQ